MTVERAVLRSSRRRGHTKGDLKEQAILATCERLLADRPLSEITVDELASGAGISRPTFYFYFESKDAVLRSLVERIAGAMLAEAEAWLAREDDPFEVVTERAIAASAAVWRDHGRVLRAAVETWGAQPETRQVGERLVQGFVDQAAQSIEEARAKGDAPPGPDASALATALINMNQQCFYTSSLGGGPALAEDDLVPILTTIWLRAIYTEVTPRAEA